MPKAKKPEFIDRTDQTPQARIVRLQGRSKMRPPLIIGMFGFAFVMLLFIFSIPILLQVLPHLADIERLRVENPKTTAFIERHLAQRGRERLHTPMTFVPYKNISSYLKSAVLVAEDDAFFEHGGVNSEQMLEAAKENIEAMRFVRGASTITMQLIKNLYFQPQKTLIRKAAEMVLTFYIELRLSKERIFELYLNYVGWGKGAFGCEAAARVHFHTSCNNLTLGQSVRLASVLINPGRFSPFSTAKRMQAKRARIALRMWKWGYITKEEYQAGGF